MPYTYDVSCHVTPVIDICGTPDISLNIILHPTTTIDVSTTINQTNAMTVTKACHGATTVAYTHTPQFTFTIGGSQSKTTQGSTTSGSKTIVSG